MQSVPTVQPAGSNAKVVPSLSICGFTVQRGLPCSSAAMGACGSRTMSFWVPATSTSVCRIAEMVTVSPARPVAEVMTIVAWIGSEVAVGVAVPVGVGMPGVVGVAVAVDVRVSVTVADVVAVAVTVALTVPVGVPVGVTVAVAVPTG